MASGKTDRKPRHHRSDRPAGAAGTPIKPQHPEVPAMTMIRRSNPWDLRSPKADEIKPKQIRISAAATDATPEPELVGAGSRR